MIVDYAGYLAFRDAFAEVMDQRYHTLEWLDEQVLEGKTQVWRSPNAAVITEIRHYPTGAKDVHALIGAGNLTEILEIITPLIEQWARSIGSIATQVESREGWSKALAPYGYQPFQLIVRKEL